MTLHFDELKERLRQALDRLETQGDASELEALLRDRSEQIASHEHDVATRREVGEVIVVRRGRSHFGFPIQEVEEVRDVTVARLPHRTPHICGLFQLRGQILCLVDLQPFIGATPALEHGERAQALVLRGRGGSLGVRIDEVVGPRTLYADELDSGHREGHLEFVSAVTQDCVEVIDISILLASPELKMTGGR